MRKLIVALVIVVALLAIGDRVAVALVENKLADRIAAHEGVDEAEVDIKGFPFLTQVLGNHFDEVEVTLPTLDADTRAGSLQVEQLKVVLHDLETRDSFSQASARRVTGSGSIAYSEFDQLSRVSVGYGGDGLIEVSLPGVSLLLQPDLIDGLTLDLESLDPNSAIPAPLRSLLQQSLAVSGLPAGVTVEDVTATEDGLELTLTGKNIDIAG